jgi:hypothetical protein
MQYLEPASQPCRQGNRATGEPSPSALLLGKAIIGGFTQSTPDDLALPWQKFPEIPGVDEEAGNLGDSCQPRSTRCPCARRLRLSQNQRSGPALSRSDRIGDSPGYEAVFVVRIVAIASFTEQLYQLSGVKGLSE